VAIHGLYAFADMMRPLSRRLLAEGWPRVDRLGYSSFRNDLESIVALLSAAVRPLAADGPVDLVGHSLGAVVARAWTKLYGGDRYVRRLVSLAGPHQGTEIWHLAPPRLRPALDPEGPWVARLADGPEAVPTIIIRSRYDREVLPPDRARIPGVQEVVVDTSGHNGLLWSRRAHDEVVRYLLAP
jgi:triacylglycerol lipase